MYQLSTGMAEAELILIPDDSEVSLLDLVVGLHRPESAVVKEGHEEALRKVVQVLSERNFEHGLSE